MRGQLDFLTADHPGATTRRGFLRVCGSAAIAIAGASKFLTSDRGFADPAETWLPIPDQSWTVGTPVYLDLADYCTDPTADPELFELDQLLPPGLTLDGGVISGIPTAEAGAGQYVATAEIDLVTGAPTEGQAPVAKPSLVAFPNPTAGAVTFTGERRSDQDATGILRVFAVSGRMLFEKSVHVTGSRFQVSWDGQGGDGRRLASGIYMVTLSAGSEMARTRLIVTQ